MSGTVTARRRGLRTATFALVLTTSAVFAHVLAGGMSPSLPVVAGCSGAMLVLGWALSARDRSAAALAVVGFVGQLALHLTFSLSMPGRMSMGSMVCGHPDQPAPPGLRRIQIAQPGAAATSHQMLLMMLAHTLGGVVVLLALRSAEAVAAMIAGVLTAVLLWALPVAQPSVVRRRRLTGPVFRVRASVVFLVSPRRGPPVSVCS